MPRFAPLGEIVWSSLPDVEAADGADDWIRDLDLSPASLKELPSLIVRDSEQGRLWLIEIATRGRPLTTDWLNFLKAILNKLPEHLLFLNAFENRREFGRVVGDLDDLTWGTVAWTADEPDHLMHFDEQAMRRGLQPYERCPPRSSSDSSQPPYSSHHASS